MFTDGMLGFIHSNETRVEFSRIGRDFSLDFVKGLCIIMVIFDHSLSHDLKHDIWFFLWGLPAVPLFLLIQVFHAYKKGYDSCKWNILKVIKRAFVPFLLVELLIIGFTMVLHPTELWVQIIKKSAYWGGMGPGSYYPWVYFQFALLLPLLSPLFRQLSIAQLTIIFLGGSIGVEVFFSLLQPPDWVYRLLCIRYIYLIYLGYLLLEKGIALNFYTICLSVVSLLFSWFFYIKGGVLFPFFYNSIEWPTCHWVCYFYIVYPLLYVLCNYFYRLSSNSFVENFICALGSHSYAVYIFQMFYFAIIAPFVSKQLDILGNSKLEVFLYVLISIFICSFPVVQFVRGESDRVILRKIIIWLFLLLGCVLFIIWRWRPYYTPIKSFPPYAVTQHHDDTLRVIMVGDSWIHFHETLKRDSTFEEQIKKLLGSNKVKVTAKGKGGAVSGEVYQRMSAELTMALDYDLDYCSQDVIKAGADYCVLSVGINDARQRRGKYYYVTNYENILRLLLINHIKPVVMEIPDVYVDGAYDWNSIFYRMKAKICMSVLDTKLRGVGDYRQALKDSLELHHLMDSIIYIPAVSWNPEGWRDKRDIYTDDHFHLNLLGYKILDSTFAAEIVKDYLKRKQ